MSDPRALPAPLRDAIDACRRALDASPWENPREALTEACVEALGPVPDVLHGARAEQAAVRRPDLSARLAREGGLLALPGRSGGSPSAAERARARVRRAIGEEPRADGLDAREGEIEWSAVVHLPSEGARWPALRRRGLLALRCAQSVAPVWLHAHPDDERPLALIDDLADAIDTFAARERTIRDALERETHAADPALTALRAIVLAHDLATWSEAHLETVSLQDLCAYAWLDAPPELVPAARSHEPPARAEAWFRWWLDEALPEAWRAA